MSETPEINGWAPPVIYDVGLGERRVATQTDIDDLVAVANAYGEMRRKMAEIDAHHAAMAGEARRRHGLGNT